MTGDDMASLTNGMKKITIKLKMPTPEEHVAKQQKQIEEKVKKPRAPRKPAVPRQPKVSKPSQPLAQSSGPAPALLVQPVSAATVSSQPNPAEVMSDVSPKLDPFTNSYQMPTSQSVSEQADNAPRAAEPQPNVYGLNEPRQQGISATEAALESVSYAPPSVSEQPSTYAYVIPETPTHHQSRSSNSHQQMSNGPTTSGFELPAADSANPAHLDKNTNPQEGVATNVPLVTTPSRGAANGLPVFTSQSHIPFGPPPPVTPKHVPGDFSKEDPVYKQESSVWDIPETPQQQ
jgi:histone deacetylase HOS3